MSHVASYLSVLSPLAPYTTKQNKKKIYSAKISYHDVSFLAFIFNLYLFLHSINNAFPQDDSTPEMISQVLWHERIMIQGNIAQTRLQQK